MGRMIGVDSDMRREGEPTKQYDPDAELARAFGLGCLVLLGVFLVGWALIAFFWLQ